jgi:hypothetical protein
VRPLRRAVVVPLALTFLVAACTSSGASPSSAPSDASPSATASIAETPAETASASAEPTITPTAAVTPTAAPATPTPKPFVHGEYLLFIRLVTFRAGGFQPQLWVVRPDGSGLRMLAEGHKATISPNAYDLAAVWSHDGTKIHVVRDCDSKLSDIRVSDWVETPIVTMGDKAADFVWSSDDSEIAYWLYTAADHICAQNSIDDTRDLMIMTSAGASQTAVSHNIGELRATSWWPTERSLLARDSGSLSRVSLPGGSATAMGITNVKWYPPAAVSPDGMRVAYMGTDDHVRTRAVAGGVIRDLGLGTGFAWSPDSTSLAVTGSTLRKCVAATGVCSGLYGSPTTLPTWSPNGANIAFVNTTTGQVLVIGASGGPVTPVPGALGFTQTSYAFVRETLQWQP